MVSVRPEDARAFSAASLGRSARNALAHIETATPTSWLPSLKRVLELSIRLPELAFSMETEKRRLLLNMVCLNLKLDEESLCADYQTPWSLLAQRPSTSNMGPRRCVAGNEFGLKRRLKPDYFLLPDPTKASLGERLRYMRKRLHMTIEDLSRKSRLSHNAIARFERDETRKTNPWVLGRIFPFLASHFKETFPEAKGDAYNFLIPPVSFGAWLQNLRLRRGLQLRQLAKLLGVHPYTLIRYERNQTTPAQAVRLRLKNRFGLNSELDRYF